jgi:hypothetical protein
MQLAVLTHAVAAAVAALAGQSVMLVQQQLETALLDLQAGSLAAWKRTNASQLVAGWKPLLRHTAVRPSMVRHEFRPKLKCAASAAAAALASNTYLQQQQQRQQSGRQLLQRPTGLLLVAVAPAAVAAAAAASAVHKLPRRQPLPLLLFVLQGSSPTSINRRTLLQTTA